MLIKAAPSPFSPIRWRGDDKTRSLTVSVMCRAMSNGKAQQVSRQSLKRDKLDEFAMSTPSGLQDPIRVQGVKIQGITYYIFGGREGRLERCSGRIDQSDEAAERGCIRLCILY